MKNLKDTSELQVLAFADWYLPGCKGGGAVSAISNLIELLGDDFHFCAFTRNRDSTEDQPYADIEFDQWAPVGKAKGRARLRPKRTQVTGPRGK
jgi:hypothetical protein